MISKKQWNAQEESKVKMHWWTHLDSFPLLKCGSDTQLKDQLWPLPFICPKVILSILDHVYEKTKCMIKKIVSDSNILPWLILNKKIYWEGDVRIIIYIFFSNGKRSVRNVVSKENLNHWLNSHRRLMQTLPAFLCYPCFESWKSVSHANAEHWKFYHK